MKILNARLDNSTHAAFGVLAARSHTNKSAVLRKLIDQHLLKNKTRIVRELIITEAKRTAFNLFVTVSFVKDDSPLSGQWPSRIPPGSPRPLGSLPLFHRDFALGDRLMRSYISSMRRRLVGKGNLPAIAISENVKKNKIERTFLHYHGLMQVDEGRIFEFREMSSEFWTQTGLRNFGQPIKCEIEILRSKEAALTYALKNVDDDYPIDRIIMVGCN